MIISNKLRLTSELKQQETKRKQQEIKKKKPKLLKVTFSIIQRVLVF